MEARFYYATCQLGAEKAVKAEVLAELPTLRFAFSRPGFITFKEVDPAKKPLTLKKAIFTRQWGEVMGQVKDAEAIRGLLEQIPEQAFVHAFDRDLFVPGDEPDEFVQNSNIHGILLSFGIDLDMVTDRSTKGETVYDLIWIDGSHVFLGRHVHGARECGDPGNIPVMDLPAESPSRAYLKIEEAFLRFQPEMKKGIQVLEVGCSPGGATTAMSMRGFKVTGVDPKFMAKEVYDLPGFQFIQKCARDVIQPDLKSVNPDWLVMDMNIAPLEALDELNHVVTLLKKIHGPKLKLSQGFLTIKLNDWKFASSIPLYLKRLESIGFKGLHPIQLWSNRQEFFVYASGFKR
jgi:23S rRNA (cytidine2498-2'-O)-methyltransferase